MPPSVARLAGGRRGPRPPRRERQRDPRRLPRTCRCRATAAGAAAADRPGADSAADRSALLAGPTSSGSAATTVPQTATPWPSPAAAGRRRRHPAPRGVGRRSPAIGGAQRAVVTRFEGANAIVIAAPPDVQRTLGEVIRQLDTRREQVLVEAIIVEISDTDRAASSASSFLLGPARQRHPVRDHQLFATQRPISARSPARSRARELGGTHDHRHTGTGTTRPPPPAPAPTCIDAVGDQLDPGRQRRLRRRSRFNIGKDAIFGAIINAVQSDNHVEHPVDAVDHDARQSGGAHPGRPGNPDHHRPGAVSSNFDNAFRTVQRAECRHPPCEVKAADQRGRHDQAGPAQRGQLDRRAGRRRQSSDLILNKREIETTITVDDGQIVGDRRPARRQRAADDRASPAARRHPGGRQSVPLARAASRTQTNLMVFIRPTILRTAEDARRVTAQRYGYVRGQQRPAPRPRADASTSWCATIWAPRRRLPRRTVARRIDDPRVAVPTQRRRRPTPEVGRVGGTGLDRSRSSGDDRGGGR